MKTVNTGRVLDTGHWTFWKSTWIAWMASASSLELRLRGNAAVASNSQGRAPQLGSTEMGFAAGWPAVLAIATCRFWWCVMWYDVNKICILYIIYSDIQLSFFASNVFPLNQAATRRSQFSKLTRKLFWFNRTEWRTVSDDFYLVRNEEKTHLDEHSSLSIVQAINGW